MLDELFWGAAWLYKATGEKAFMDLLENSRGNTGGTRSTFSWDDNYVGVQVLAAKHVLDGKVASSGSWSGYKAEAEQFIGKCIQKVDNNNNVVKTSGGLLWFDPWNNLQYTTSASFILSVYAEYLSASGKALTCGSSLVNPSDLLAFARSQVNYILGANPRNTSYVVGFGSKYPEKVHHRAASIVSIKKDSTPVGCKEGFTNWFYKEQPNPNVLVGAVVGGPDKKISMWMKGAISNKLNLLLLPLLPLLALLLA